MDRGGSRRVTLFDYDAQRLANINQATVGGARSAAVEGPRGGGGDYGSAPPSWATEASYVGSGAYAPLVTQTVSSFEANDAVAMLADRVRVLAEEALPAATKRSYVLEERLDRVVGMLEEQRMQLERLTTAVEELARAATAAVEPDEAVPDAVGRATDALFAEEFQALHNDALEKARRRKRRARDVEGDAAAVATSAAARSTALR